MMVAIAMHFQQLSAGITDGSMFLALVLPFFADSSTIWAPIFPKKMFLHYKRNDFTTKTAIKHSTVAHLAILWLR